MPVENQTERELSMTTVFRDDLIRIQVLRRRCGDDNSQTCVSRALDALESVLSETAAGARA